MIILGVSENLEISNKCIIKVNDYLEQYWIVENIEKEIEGSKLL